MLKNIKKTVGYDGNDYKITFNTVETHDFDINYVIVNGYDVDIRDYNSNHSNDEIDNFILKGILEYIKLQSKPDTVIDTDTMSMFNNVPNKLITDTDGNKHWISPSISVDALLVVNGFVLVVKRSENMSNPNLWCLPCGFMDWQEDFLHACMRELYEETGVNIRAHNIINADYNRPHALNGTAIQFVFELLERPIIILNDDECITYAWVSASMLKDYDFAFGHDRLIEYLTLKESDNIITKVVYSFQKLEKTIEVDENFIIPSYGVKVNEFNEWLRVLKVENKQGIFHIKLEEL